MERTKAEGKALGNSRDRAFQEVVMFFLYSEFVEVIP